MKFFFYFAPIEISPYFFFDFYKVKRPAFRIFSSPILTIKRPFTLELSSLSIFTSCLLSRQSEALKKQAVSPAGSLLENQRAVGKLVSEPACCELLSGDREQRERARGRNTDFCLPKPNANSQRLGGLEVCAISSRTNPGCLLTWCVI